MKNKFLRLTKIFLLGTGLLLVSLYAQLARVTAQNSPTLSVTLNPSCLNSYLPNTIKANISWSPSGIYEYVNFVILGGVGQNTFVRQVANTTTSLVAPDDFGNGLFSLFSDTTYQVSLDDVGDGDDNPNSVSTRFTVPACQTTYDPGLIPQISWNVCRLGDDDITLSGNKFNVSWPAGRTVTDAVISYQDCDTDNNCTATLSSKKNSVNGSSIIGPEGFVPYSSLAIINGSSRAYKLRLLSSGTYGPEVDLAPPRCPIPESPSVCRNSTDDPADSYNDSELAINRTNVQNNPEWVYIIREYFDPKLQGWIPADYTQKQVDDPTQTAIPAPTGFGPLGAGLTYVTRICNKPVDPNASASNVFCSAPSLRFCLPNFSNPCKGGTAINNICLAPTPAPVPECGNTGTDTGSSIRSDAFLTAKGEEATPNRIYTTGKCIIGQPASIPQFSLRSYAETKSLYFNQNKQSNLKTVLEGNQIQHNKVQPVNLEAGNTDHLYHIKGSYAIQSDFNVKKAGVIFVDGDLSIENNITESPGDSGLVFLVAGSIKIKDTVTKANAFMVTWGGFCSGWTGVCENIWSDTDPAEKLEIKGSLISLSPSEEPKFVRALKYTQNKTDPAEKIIFQPKYLILLKNIFTRDLTVWSEVE